MRRNSGGLGIPTFWSRLCSGFFCVRLGSSLYSVRIAVDPNKGRKWTETTARPRSATAFRWIVSKAMTIQVFTLRERLSEVAGTYLFLLSCLSPDMAGPLPTKWYVYLQHSSAYSFADTGNKNIAVPLILQFFIGASITCLFNMCGTLLTDPNSRNTALAQASSNIVRCALSASGLAALQEMISHMGPGWTFTMFAGLCLLTAPMILAVMRWGFGWRSGGQQNVELQVNTEAKSQRA